jgi:hypothetical protein
MTKELLGVLKSCGALGILIAFDRDEAPASSPLSASISLSCSSSASAAKAGRMSERTCYFAKPP